MEPYASPARRTGSTSVEGPARALLRLSHELLGLPDLQSYLETAAAELLALLSADRVAWLELDLQRARATVLRGSAMRPAPALAVALLHAPDHPTLRSYFDAPADLGPRRLSDLGETGCAALLPELLGIHQLSLVVRLSPCQARWDGWVLGRSVGDFSAADRDTAAALLPVLTVLDQLHRSPSRLVDADVDAPGLTPREVEVLQLLAEGLTAQAIAHAQHISARTVRKHLEHTYAKLGCSDRLVAVERARQAGLLPVSAR